MNNPSKKKTILTVAGLLLLILACVAAVELIFLGLGEAIPNESRDSGQSVSVQPDQSAPGQAAPSFCPFCRACPPPSSGASSAPSAGSGWSPREENLKWKRI